MSCSTYVIIANVFYMISVISAVAVVIWLIITSSKTSKRSCVVRSVSVSFLTIAFSCFSISITANTHCKEIILDCSDDWTVFVSNDSSIDMYKQKYVLAAISVLEFEANGDALIIVDSITRFRDSCEIAQYNTDRLYNF
jgi:hypothetical protein